ncbi:MAG TPA: hypothetical protein PKK26_09470 [Candidatus Wallbacteria bacterium]|nr:hypothetical protein [Candidatus Wallbacteria bacterium]
MITSVLTRKFYIIIILLLSFQMAGCSCGEKKAGKKLIYESGRTYESDAEEMRTESAMPGMGKDGVAYLGKGYGKGEKPPELEALEKAGKDAAKNKDFKIAESLLAEGNYSEAIKYYSRTGGNIYVERRMAACKASMERVEALENPEIKKASQLMVDGRPEDALGVLNGIEKSAESGPETNVFLAKRVNAMKLRIYKNNDNDKGLATEYEKQIKIQDKVLKKTANTWTPPIER